MRGGAPPLMRERRINRAYDALWIGPVASTRRASMKNTFAKDTARYLKET